MESIQVNNARTRAKRPSVRTNAFPRSQNVAAQRKNTVLRFRLPIVQTVGLFSTTKPVHEPQCTYEYALLDNMHGLSFCTLARSVCI